MQVDTWNIPACEAGVPCQETWYRLAWWGWKNELTFSGMRIPVEVVCLTHA